MTGTIQTTAIPSLGPDLGRVDVELPEGLTVAQIVAQVLPGLEAGALQRLRVWLVSNEGEQLLANSALWHRIRPRPGVRVMIRLVPAGDVLRNALLIAVSIAAVAVGQFWVGPAIAAATGSALLGQIGAAVAVTALTLAGSYLVNLLIPPMQAGSQQGEQPLFSISGWQNQSTPDGVVPSPFGRVRIAPVFAAPSYSEIVGDEQYLRALFTFGYGPVELSQLKIKDTPVDKFIGVETQVRQGFPDDDPITLYPSQVIEDSLGVELRRDRERDDAGNIVGPGPLEPVARFTATDVTEASVIFHFPTGLIRFDDNGRAQNRTVSVRIRQRPASGGAWETVHTINFTAKRREGFFRQHRWTLPSRGRWEIECTRTTHEPVKSGGLGRPDEIDPQIADRVTWLALQSFRPEYPLNFDKALCLVAMRVKATYQLNSTLETFNAIAERLISDYDHDTGQWVLRKTRNPASHFRHALQGPENAYPESDTAIDLDQLQDWHDFCRVKGLKYDRNRNFDASKWEALAEIAAAGRAAPRYDGLRWGVVIDRPQELVVAHINSRNSRDFSWTRNYVEPPHAFRVPFLDETADFQQRERIVRWPGYTGDINVTEQLALPGKTDPAEIWREARRRQYEIIHRPDRFTAVQDGGVRSATRGDYVKGSYETLVRTMSALRVSAVRDQYLTLDGWVEMDAGTGYAVRFMRQVGDGDNATFESTLRQVRTVPGRTDSIALSGDGAVPEPGEIVQFGIAGQESLDLVVAGTQSGEEMTSVLTMLAQAPIIDQLTDAEVPPEWNGRAGGDASADISVPAVPVVVAIEPNFDQSGDPDGLIVLLEPGPGSSAVLATFTVRHRLAGTATWTEATADMSEGAVVVSGYSPGAEIEMQRRATSVEGYPSEWSAIFTAEGAVAAPEPIPQPIASGSVSGGAGEATISVSTPNDAWVDQVRLAYGTNADGSGRTDLVSFPAEASTTYVRTEPVPAGSHYFFAETLNSESQPSSLYHLGQATVT